MKLVVLGRNEKLTDLPEFKTLNHTARIEARSRTLDYAPETKLLAVGEENVLANPKDPNASESQVIRVFAKALYQVADTRAVDPNWETRGRDLQQYELRLKRLEPMCGEHDIDPFQAGATKTGRLPSESRNPESARITRRQAHAVIVEALDPDIEILSGERRAFEHGMLPCPR